MRYNMGYMTTGTHGGSPLWRIARIEAGGTGGAPLLPPGEAVTPPFRFLHPIDPKAMATMGADLEADPSFLYNGLSIQVEEGRLPDTVAGVIGLARLAARDPDEFIRVYNAFLSDGELRLPQE